MNPLIQSKNAKILPLLIALTLGGVALPMILDFAVPSAQSASTATLTAVVQRQRYIGIADDHVEVTFTATLNPMPPNVGFQWDFDNDGRFDTRLRSQPGVNHVYHCSGGVVTAVVRAVNGSRSATDSVTLEVLRCN